MGHATPVGDAGFGHHISVGLNSVPLTDKNVSSSYLPSIFLHLAGLHETKLLDPVGRMYTRNVVKSTVSWILSFHPFPPATLNTQLLFQAEVQISMVIGREV